MVHVLNVIITYVCILLMLQEHSNFFKYGGAISAFLLSYVGTTWGIYVYRKGGKYDQLSVKNVSNCDKLLLLFVR